MNNVIDKENQIELYENEASIIKFIDIDKISTQQCIKKMNISMKEFNELLSNARYKLAQSMIKGIPIKVVNDIKPQEIITTLCKFRCAICGEIYSINYLKDEIICPLCNSNKIMSHKEASF